MVSPFPFLKNAPDDLISHIHGIILSKRPANEKHKDILNCLPCGGGDVYVQNYVAWTNQKKVPPNEILSELEPDKKALLLEYVNYREWYGTSILLWNLSSSVHPIAEEWLRLMKDDRQMLEYTMAEATETLLQLIEKQKIHEHGDQTIPSESTSTEAKSDKPYSLPMVSDIREDNQPRNSKHFSNTDAPDRKIQPIVREANVEDRHFDCDRCPRMVDVCIQADMEPEVDEQDCAKAPKEKLTHSDPYNNLKSNIKRKNVSGAGGRVIPLLAGVSKLKEDDSIGDIEPKHVYNIILLGETGVGKTTFINGLANYIKYASMDEALEKGPVILMKSSFTITNVKATDKTTAMTQKTVTVDANYDKGIKNMANEQFKEGGKSRTQDPLIHHIPFEEDGITKLLQIIDTPGVNDTRGRAQDEANFDKILSLIRKIGYLNAICILLKPNESKLSLGFRDCLNNILNNLHRSATKNTLFCFTNTRSTFYRPGDTITILSQYLEELCRKSGVLIQANRENIFCFDNDCFRYMCTLMKDSQAKTESEHATLSTGWIHNAQECRKLLAKVKELVAHQVEDTVNIRITRGLLNAIAGTLIESALNHIVNRRMLEKNLVEIQRQRVKSVKSETNVNLRQIQIALIKMKKLRDPIIVCEAPKCNEVAYDAVGELYQIPKRACHTKCMGITPLYRGHPSLQKAKYFDEHTGKCKICKCYWNFHTYMPYKYVRICVPIASQEQENQLRACTNANEKAELVLKVLQTELANIEDEYNLIKEASIEFSVFVNFNAMHAGNDPYFDHLNHAIEKEKDMASRRKETDRRLKDTSILLVDLEALLKEHREGVSRSLEEMKAEKRAPLTTTDIHKKIDKLCNMKWNGVLIENDVKTIKEQYGGELR